MATVADTGVPGNGHPDAVVDMGAYEAAPGDGCQADWNGDTLLDIFDVVAFLGDFQSGDIATDLNGDTILDIFDIVAYLGAFTAGCP